MSRFIVRMTESGVHLFNRESGLNILLDEFHQCTLSRAPANVSIALTGRCNLRCAHCFVSRVNYDLEYERVLGWLRELDGNGCLGVGFGGGEPLLYPHVFDLCAFVHRETGMACTMTTNGVLLDDVAVSHLSSTLDFCRISMDGIGKTHESIRKYSFDKLLLAVQRAAKQMKVGINYLVNDVTICDLKRVMELAAEVGARELLLLPEVATNGGVTVSEACLRQLRQCVLDYHGTVSMRISERFKDVVPGSVLIPGDVGTRAYMHIDCKGTLKRDSFSRSGYQITGGLMDAISHFNKEEAA